jgi:hypothetical protein
MNIIPIAILASDPITWEGSVALLLAHPDLLILPDLRPHAGPARHFSGRDRGGAA